MHSRESPVHSLLLPPWHATHQRLADELQQRLQLVGLAAVAEPLALGVAAGGAQGVSGRQSAAAESCARAAEYLIASSAGVCEAAAGYCGGRTRWWPVSSRAGGSSQCWAGISASAKSVAVPHQPARCLGAYR